MLVRHSKDVIPVLTKANADKKVLIGPKQGAPNFVMRIIDMPPGTSTYHTHDWEHEVYVLSGQGSLVSEDGETPLSPDDAVYVAPLEKHGFANRGEDTFRFI